MLKPDQKNKISRLGQKYGLDFIILYGSAAKKKAGPFSDVDLAVYCQRGIDSENFLSIYGEAATIFSNQEVDLKSLHGVNPLFRYYVVKDGKLIYGDQTAYNFYKAFAYRGFQEAKPLFALEEYLVNKHQKELNKLYV
jgi:predicted nucleotidyltransferase